MTTVVLVAGAWHGPWAWERVVPVLAAAGARVVTPELPFTSDVGLADHVDATVAALSTSSGGDREEVVLVGHSYAGLVVREAADRRPDLVSRLVLVDGWAGPDGSNLVSLAPPWFADLVGGVASAGLVPSPGAAALGITDPGDAAWLDARLRPHPLRTFTDPTRLTGAVDRIPGTGIHCRPATFEFAEIAAGLGYRTVGIDGPHDVMLTDPDGLATELLRT